MCSRAAGQVRIDMDRARKVWSVAAGLIVAAAGVAGGDDGPVNVTARFACAADGTERAVVIQLPADYSAEKTYPLLVYISYVCHQHFADLSGMKEQIQPVRAGPEIHAIAVDALQVRVGAQHIGLHARQRAHAEQIVLRPRRSSGSHDRVRTRGSWVPEQPECSRCANLCEPGSPPSV